MFNDLSTFSNQKESNHLVHPRIVKSHHIQCSTADSILIEFLIHCGNHRALHLGDLKEAACCLRTRAVNRMAFQWLRRLWVVQYRETAVMAPVVVGEILVIGKSFTNPRENNNSASESSPFKTYIWQKINLHSLE